jgi:iron only hydrogenase large subunit-like protein
MKQVASGTASYHFIEVMACPGGCIGGGGQPIPTNMDIRKKRAEAIYAADSSLPLRKSHENPEVVQLYNEFLHEPLGHESHHLLHTHYTPRDKG